MNIIALVTHLKLVAQEAKKYAAGLASELSNATLEAMQEMDRAKVDRLSSVPVWTGQRLTGCPLYPSRSRQPAGWRMKRGRNTPCVTTSLPQM